MEDAEKLLKVMRLFKSVIEQGKLDRYSAMCFCDDFSGHISIGLGYREITFNSLDEAISILEKGEMKWKS